MARIAVVIASRGRPDVLARTTLASLAKQSRPADEIVLSLTTPDDTPDGSEHCRVIYGGEGLCCQRNRGTASLSEFPIFVAFLDDDLILHRDYLKSMERHFEQRPNLILAMGHLLANGNVSEDAAWSLVGSSLNLGPHTGKFYATSQTWGHVYGANMCVRGTFAVQEGFDEKLPRYSLMEDVDFGTRCRRAGVVGYSYEAVAVHLRTPGGRINAKQLGFSEVMNPAYLIAKGTVPLKMFPTHVLRAPVVNMLRALVPSNNIHRQRFIGNAAALLRLLRGRIDPSLPNYLSAGDATETSGKPPIS
jgi:GT2 family glycosyltransferase